MSSQSHFELLDAEMIAQGITSAQIQDLTKQDAADIIGVEATAGFWSGGSIGYLINLRRRLVRAAQARELEADRTLFESRIEAMPGYAAKYPNAAILSRLDDDGRQINIYLDGPPAEDV